MKEISVKENRFNPSAGEESLIFPSDLQNPSATENNRNNAFYPEAVRFSIIKRNPITLEKLAGIASAGRDALDKELKLDKERQGFENELEENKQIPEKERFAENSFFEAKIKAAQNRERFKGDTNVVESLAIISEAAIKKAANILQESRESITYLKHIWLQMPQSLLFNEQLDWAGTDLGVLGALREGGFDDAAKQGLMSNAGKLAGGATFALGSKILGQSAFVGGILGAIAGSNVGSFIESTAGVRANPYKEQTFQGVPFRPFEFSFIFRARNQAEVLVVEKIITAFRAHSKPAFFSPDESGVFIYPDEFEISFKTYDFKGDNFIENPYLPVIKRCICKNVSTNYTGQGWRSLNDGAPADIVLTLSMEETEIVTQDDVLTKGN